MIKTFCPDLATLYVLVVRFSAGASMYSERDLRQSSMYIIGKRVSGER